MAGDCERPEDAPEQMDADGRTWWIGFAGLVWWGREDGAGTAAMSLTADLDVDGGDFSGVVVSDAWVFSGTDTWHAGADEVEAIEESLRIRTTGSPPWDPDNPAKVVLEFWIDDAVCGVVGREDVPVDLGD